MDKLKPEDREELEETITMEKQVYTKADLDAAIEAERRRLFYWRDSSVESPTDGQQVIFYTSQTGLRIGKHHIITNGRSMYRSRYIQVVATRVWWMPQPQLPLGDSDIDDVEDFSFKGENR